MQELSKDLSKGFCINNGHQVIQNQMHNKTRVFSAYWCSHHFSLSSEHVTQTRCTACASKAALNAWLRCLQCLYWTYKVYLGDVTVCPFEETTYWATEPDTYLGFYVCARFVGYLDSTACDLPLEVHRYFPFLDFLSIDLRHVLQGRLLEECGSLQAVP